MTLAIDASTGALLGQYLCDVQGGRFYSILGRYGYILRLATTVTLEKVS